MRRAGAGTQLALAAAVIGAGTLSAPAEELLYYTEGGRVVITNTPSRPDARPIPRLTSPVSTGGAELPATPYDAFIERVARENGLDPSLIKVVALVESGFDAQAISPKGARGIMQLMPGTARRYGVRDVHDPYENLRAGAEHLRDLLDEFGGDVTLAVAGYNAGAGAVRRYGGVPAYRETRDYVRKIRDRLGQTRRARPASTPAPPSRVSLRLQPDGSVTLEN